MPKYYEFKIAGYYLYFTSYCVIECMHVHASDRRLTEAGSAEMAWPKPPALISRFWQNTHLNVQPEKNTVPEPSHPLIHGSSQ